MCLTCPLLLLCRSYEGEEDIAKAFKKRMHNIQHPQQQAKPRGLLPTFRQ
jgi:hypothetical protein